MISHSHKFVFLHIPKNAGTSIEHYFLEQKVAPTDFNFGVNVHYDNITENIAKDYFIFAVKRNPWDRFISLWKYWTQLGTRDENKRMPQIAKKIESGELDASFPYFCHNLDKFKTLLEQKQHVHFLNQIDKNNQPAYVNPVWISFENLEKDFADVCDKIKLPFPKLKKRNSSRPKDNGYRDYYTKDLKKQIEKMYARDIEFFGYSF